TLILVGVADSVDQLIAEHRSIGRSLKQVQMPRMPREELLDLLSRGLVKLDMTMSDDAKEFIAVLSKGLPYYAHTLGLYSAQNAIDHERQDVMVEDVEVAIGEAVRNAQETLTTAYHRATRSPQSHSLHSQVLLACALAKTDGQGWFSASAVSVPMAALRSDKSKEIANFAKHLKAFTEETRGPILEKSGDPWKIVYRFIDPLLQPFV